MKAGGWLKNGVIRNILGIVAVMLIYLIPDRVTMNQRTGFARFSPYLMLLLLYGWVTFHNRFLFEGLYLKNKKRAYFFWTALLMIISSVNMHFILLYGYGHTDTISKIINFWVFTITGLGVYFIFRYLNVIQDHKPNGKNLAATDTSLSNYLTCIVDGIEKQVPLDGILYLESMENYVKVITNDKKHIIRLSLKEAEAKLPKPLFLRISRSHIVNTRFIGHITQGSLKINDNTLKIGKVYKRYVEEYLSANV
jgi:hypothetical protein